MPFASRPAMHFRIFRSRRRAQNASSRTAGEKGTRRPRNSYLDICATAVRLWQLGSSFFAYSSFAGLYSYISHYRLGEDTRMEGVKQLGLALMVYTFIVVICMGMFKMPKVHGWQFFAWSTIPGDVTMMCLAVAKITVLSMAGLPADCHGLTREDFVENDLIRQPREGFSTIRFGPGTRNNNGELDFLCHLPRSVYGLSVIAIFSYALSIHLTVFQIQRYRQRQAADVSLHPGHIEEVVPAVIPSRSLQMAQNSTQFPRPRSQPFPTEAPTQVVRRSEEEPKYANMPVDVIPGARERPSQETTSSFDPELYLVSDGFGPSVNPPSYRSRPSSLYG